MLKWWRNHHISKLAPWFTDICYFCITKGNAVPSESAVSDIEQQYVQAYRLSTCVGVCPFIHWSQTQVILNWGDNGSVAVQVPCSFLLRLFVFVIDCILFVHLAVSVLLNVPAIPRTTSLALIMLARSPKQMKSKPAQAPERNASHETDGHRQKLTDQQEQRDQQQPRDQQKPQRNM